MYGVHYNPFSDKNPTSTYPSSIFQYRTDGTGYAALQLPDYDTRGYQYLTVADDGSFVLLSNGNKIYKIDTSTTWTSGSNNAVKILCVWTLPDSANQTIIDMTSDYELTPLLSHRMAAAYATSIRQYK